MLIILIDTFAFITCKSNKYISIIGIIGVISLRL
jgi:hypothetical protein